MPTWASIPSNASKFLQFSRKNCPKRHCSKPNIWERCERCRQVVDFLGESEKNGSVEKIAPTGTPIAKEGGTGAVDLSTERLTTVLLEVVAEKTGYPAEMLQIDMDLDGDLGIDSIKRVEIFSRLQERLPDAPPVKAEHLGTLRTLRQVVEFLATPPAGNGAAQTNSVARRAASPVCPAPASCNIPLERLVLTAVDLDEDAPVNRSACLRTPSYGSLRKVAILHPRWCRRLDLLGYRARLVNLKDLLTLAKPARLAGLVIIVPPDRVHDRFLYDAFQLLQTAAGGLREVGKSAGAVFVTASRLDGSFGLSDVTQAMDPVTGGLAGLTKTARHEWPAVQCKALDVANDWEDLDEAAHAIVSEILLVGPVEVGLSPGALCTLHLVPTPLDGSEPVAPWNKGDVVVVTGGARGVTAETAVALARAYSPTLVLLGRSPAPSSEPSWLAPLTDESAIKRALLAQANGQALPRVVAEQYRALAANREMLRTIERIETAGATVHYRQVDVRDPQAIRVVIGEIRNSIGPIKGLIHGAGVLADRLIEDKTVEQFDSVYATKVGGLQAMLGALKEDDLSVLALFSSSTGRFGRTGQVDYAVANEVLNKLAQREARQRPECRVVAVNWGPWDGGMVNSSLKKIFEQEGIGVIPLEQGAEYFVRELGQAADCPVEVVVMGARPAAKLPVSGGTPVAVPLTVAFEREISVDSLPVVKSHVIKGRAVVPMALLVEWFAHGAVHANPGLAFHGFNDLRILKGIILPDHQTVLLRVLTGKAIKHDATYRVPVEIRCTATDGREVLHSRADVILAASLPRLESPALEVAGPPYSRTMSEVYNAYLFHGPDLQAIERIEICTAEGMVANVASVCSPADWVTQPLRSAWLANPQVLDCGFQMMTQWSFEQNGAFSLPCAAGRYRQFRRSFPRDGVRIVVRITSDSEQRALADMDFVDRTGEVIARLSNYECVSDVALNQAFRLNQLAI